METLTQHGFDSSAVARNRVKPSESGTANQRNALNLDFSTMNLIHGHELGTDGVLPHRIHHVFEQQARKTPNAPALSLDGQTMTYAELNRRADALAGCLSKLGVQT